MNQPLILAINPGSTSTKFAVYKGSELILEQSIAHTGEELSKYPNVVAQFDFRKSLIIDVLRCAGILPESLDAVIGRGGLVRPIPSGVYLVNDEMRNDLLRGVSGQHASNLGGLIAESVARPLSIPAYIADPVVVDEMQDVARITGLPSVPRVSIFHALNQKAVAREYSQKTGRRYEELNLIVAHMGGGISVGAHDHGRVIDVNNALDGDGPFSPERAGGLPARYVADMCLSGEYSREQIDKMLCGKGGLVAHLGTNSMQEALRTARLDSIEGKHALLIVQAMCYNVGKAIGQMAAVLHGKVDAIILTGGIAHNDEVCDYISEMVSFIAPIEIRPGEDELKAIAQNALNVLNGSIPLKQYTAE